MYVLAIVKGRWLHSCSSLILSLSIIFNSGYNRAEVECMFWIGRKLELYWSGQHTKQSGHIRKSTGSMLVSKLNIMSMILKRCGKIDIDTIGIMCLLVNEP